MVEVGIGAGGVDHDIALAAGKRIALALQADGRTRGDVGRARNNQTPVPGVGQRAVGTRTALHADQQAGTRTLGVIAGNVDRGIDLEGSAIVHDDVAATDIDMVVHHQIAAAKDNIGLRVGDGADARADAITGQGAEDAARAAIDGQDGSQDVLNVAGNDAGVGHGADGCIASES